MSSTSQLGRPWRGVSADQRIAERRERLLVAGLEVFAVTGFHASKVRDICADAGLSERYFYESFVDKEALLRAVAERIVGEFVAAVAPTITLIESNFDVAADATARAVISSLTDDPRRARILFVEMVGVSSELEDQRRLAIGSLVDVIRGAVATAFGPWADDSIEVELIARAVIGAVQELLIAHVRGELPIDQDGLVANFRTLFLRARPIVEALAPATDSQERTR